MVGSYDAGKVVGGPGWIPLHRNENHFIPAEWIESVLRGDDGTNYARYPDPLSGELRKRLATLYGVDASNIFVGNGSDGVLADLLALFRQQYSEINLPQVGYKVYDILADRLSFSVNRYVTGLSHPQVSSFSGLSVIDSPNAITGSTMAPDLIEAISADGDNFVIWDNCYGDFESKQLRQIGNLSNAVIVRSFSKYYGLAGLRIGYCIASSAVVSELDRRKDVYNVNSVAQHMALRALERSSEYDAFSMRMMRARGDLQKHLSSLGFHVLEPHGNFIFASHPTIAGDELQARLEDRNILVRRFDYPEIANWLRVTVPAEGNLGFVCEAFETAVTGENRVLLSAGA